MKKLGLISAFCLTYIAPIGMESHYFPSEMPGDNYFYGEENLTSHMAYYPDGVSSSYSTQDVRLDPQYYPAFPYIYEAEASPIDCFIRKEEEIVLSYLQLAYGVRLSSASPMTLNYNEEMDELYVRGSVQNRSAFTSSTILHSLYDISNIVLPKRQYWQLQAQDYYLYLIKE